MARTLPKHRAREYETIFIMHPDSTSATIDKVADRCTEVVGRLEGKLLKAENWGRRRLAYPVKKNRKGVYIYLRYLGYQDMVRELERNLRLLDPVIKYLTVKVDEDVNPEARPVNEEDISFLPRYEEEEPPEAVKVEEEPAVTEAKPEEVKPAETKPEEAKPAEAKPAEAKPAEAKPAEAKPEEAKPAEAKPEEAKADEPAPAPEATETEKEE